jgi:uncharacterized protein
MFVRRLVIITLMLCFGACLHQAIAPLAYADFDDATAAYSRGDYETAFKAFKLLASEGNPEAQFNVGLMWHKGQGVIYQDDNEAVKWFRKSADQEYPKAQFNLGVMYSDGSGVPKDKDEAAKWFRKAAEQDHAVAQFNLGVMYGMGQGVPRDLVQAHMWLSLAAQQGDSEAQIEREKVAKMMTKSQLAEAERLAKQWKPKGKGFPMPDSFSR